jgi:hypothetical protein
VNDHLAQTPEDIQELLHPVESSPVVSTVEEEGASSPFKIGDRVKWLGDGFDGAWGCYGTVIDYLFSDIKVRWTREDSTYFDRRQSSDEVALIDNLLSA